jgi:UDP-N-acetylmuramate dehydrogenase
MNNEECKFSYRDSVFKLENNDLLVSSIKLKLTKEPKTNTSYKSLNNYLIRDDIDPDYATPFQVCRAVTSIRNKILPNYRHEPNVGSFFKNLTVKEQKLDDLSNKISGLPYYKNADGLTYKVPVAFLIENAGWKGYKQGKVRVSERHALVLIADEGATSDELLSLSSAITEDIYEKTQVKIEIEPEVI